MHFALSEEQAELVSTVRSLLAKRSDSHAVRAAVETSAGLDEDLWRTLCEQIGVAALALPEEYDGAGATLFETCVVLEELGRTLTPSPLLASTIAAQTLLGTGNADLCAELLPRIAAGEIATLVTAAGVSTSHGSAISGTAHNVLDGDQATILLVAARSADHHTALFLVDPSLVDTTWTPTMDQTLRMATLTFDGVPGTLVTDDAVDALARGRRTALVAVAALQTGCAQRGLDMTVDYSKERVQFGRPIGSFQALKHRMADMLVSVETARSAAWAAGYAVATDAEDAGALAAVAASYCTEALDHVAGETIQLHGGIAITWEHDAHLVFKRAHALHQLLGAPHQLRASLIS
jgi:alkylation response protein AidB-like acyl-CoA dehydrogenase